MSQICGKCGKEIPEGAPACPVCGWTVPEEEMMKALMAELTKSMNQNPDPATEKTTGSADLDQEIKDMETAVDREQTQADMPGDTAAKAEFESIPVPENEGAGEFASLFEEGRPIQPVKKKAPPKKNGASQRNGSRPQQRPANGKKKKKKKNGVSAGVIVAIVILSLLLIGIVAAAGYLLMQMGFFEKKTDAELLGIPAQSVLEQELEEPSVSEESVVSEEPEASVEESAEESAEELDASVEESVIEEAVEEPVEGAEPEEETAPGEPVDCTKFSITGADNISLYSRGETTKLVYVIEPVGVEQFIEWESSDPSVASVNSYGVISAKRGGTCEITGTCGERSITATINCEFTVPDTILDMNYEDVTMSYEGQTLQLEVDADLNDTQKNSIVWETSDANVVMVDTDGLITAVADGTAIVTATIGEYTASCIVRCNNVTGNKGVNSKDSEYTINHEDVTLTVKGEYFQLTITSIFGNEVPEFTWESSDTSVATIDSKGIVTAVGAGTAYITTTVGGDDFQCIVRVRLS